MSLLEGLALGKPVIAPKGVGIVPELEEAEELLRYPAGDGEALVALVRGCYERKLRGSRLVQGRSWERWGEEHDRLFRRLVEANGKRQESKDTNKTMRLSLIVNVLESYEVVRRQLLHLGRILPEGCEVILVDDGSSPSLQETCEGMQKPFPFTLHCTNDRRPWTQPRARNIGAGLAQAPWLLFFDIDHILTAELLALCLEYTGDKLHWVRRPGVIDEEGRVVSDRAELLRHGLKEEAPAVHANSFLIRAELFQHLGGYDERFCGRYGGDDIDFNERYEQLCAMGQARPAEVRGEGYYYPDPAHVSQLFHRLRRVPG
jgi:hypothetical protein